MKTFNKVIGVILALATCMFIGYGWLGATYKQGEYAEQNKKYYEACSKYLYIFNACYTLGMSQQEIEPLFINLITLDMEEHIPRVYGSEADLDAIKTSMNDFMSRYASYVKQYEELPSDLKAALNEYEHTNVYNVMKLEIDGFAEVMGERYSEDVRWTNRNKSNSKEFNEAYLKYLQANENFYGRLVPYLHSEEGKAVVENMKSEYYKDAIHYGSTLYMMLDELSADDANGIGKGFKKVRTAYEELTAAKAELERYE